MQEYFKLIAVFMSRNYKKRDFEEEIYYFKGQMGQMGQIGDGYSFTMCPPLKASY